MEIERQDQLAVLRRRIARIDRKYANTGRRTRPARPNIEQLLPGEIVRTRFGEHFETEKVWEPHRRYGSVGNWPNCPWTSCTRFLRVRSRAPIRAAGRFSIPKPRGLARDRMRSWSA